MTKLLVKEFVDFARALSTAGDRKADIFKQFLVDAGYESLNDYKARGETGEDIGGTQQADHFVMWLEELKNDEPVFEWINYDGKKPTYREEEVDAAVEKAIDKVLTETEEELVDKDVEGDDEEETLDVQGWIDGDEKTQRLIAAVQAFADGGGGGGGTVDDATVKKHTTQIGQQAKRLGEFEAITKVQEKLCRGALTKLDVMEKEMSDHFGNDAMHAGGGAPSFRINVNPAKESYSTEQPLHYKFPLVAAAVSNRIPTMIVGPAGWGKTSTIKALADVASDAWEEEEVEYIIQSIGPQTSKADILGYMDANGKYVESQFRKCFEHGYIYACDEADAGSAGSLTLLNQGFANTECSFPDSGMVERHDNFVPLFLANTYGQGANATYVGRNQLDAATLDRFAVVEYDYDVAWEAKICGINKKGNELKLEAGGKRTPEEWVDYVDRVRNSVDSLAVRHVVSPRASINGIKLLKAGLGFTHVSNMCVWKGMDSATRAKIQNEMDNG